MEYEMQVAQEGVKLSHLEDERRRSEISKMLGFVQDVLSWAQIYFEIGKLKAIYDTTRDIKEIQRNMRGVLTQLNELNGEVFKGKKHENRIQSSNAFYST